MGPKIQQLATSTKSSINVLLILFVAVVLGVLAAPASAQNTDGPNELDSADEIGRGTCSPTVLQLNQRTTCRFPLNGATDLPNYPFHAYIIQDWVPTNGVMSDRCLIEGGDLVCTGLRASGVAGEFEVGLKFLPGIPDLGGLASVEYAPAPDRFVEPDLVLPSGPTYTGEIEFSLVRAQTGRESVDLLIRREGSDEVVEQVSGLGPLDYAKDVVLDFSESGRWTVTPCKLAPNGQCRTEATPQELNLIDPLPLPLTPGHNGPAAERINIVFAGNGFGPIDELSLQEEALRLLGLDGEPEFLETDFDDGGSVGGLRWGAFSIDPLRENVNRFNFWYLEDEMRWHDVPMVYGGPSPPLDPIPLGLGEDVVLVLVDRFDAGARALRATSNRVFEFGPTRGGLGSVYLPVPHRGDEWWFDDDHHTLAHELGHAVFGLLDEYAVGQFVQLSLPNCVRTEEIAEAAWGDMLGELDPMFDRWVLESQKFGVSGDPRLDAAQFTVGYVNGGCWGPDGGDEAVRPTINSIMKSDVPVFGSVNRSWVERILARWPEPSTTLSSQPGPDAAICDGVAATIVGTAGDDRLVGTPGPDVIAGLQGDDQIIGLGGDDVLCGGKGNDVIFGGEGFDVIYGAQGDDKIFGANGRSVADRIDSLGGRYFGGAGNDSIYGTNRWDRMQGGAGADSLFGFAARDWMRGGFGNDHVDGGPAIDDLHGGWGNDVLISSAGDTVNGGPGKQDRCSRTAGVAQTMTACELS